MQRADSLSFRETAREGCFPAARACAREHEWSLSEDVRVGPPALFVFLWPLGLVHMRVAGLCWKRECEIHMCILIGVQNSSG